MKLPRCHVGALAPAGDLDRCELPLEIGVKLEEGWPLFRGFVDREGK